MRTTALVILLTITLASAFGKRPPPPDAVADSKAGAVTAAELKVAVDRYVRQIRRLSPDKVFSPSETAELEASTLTDLVLRKIFLAMAAKQGIEALDSEVRERFNIVCSGLFDNDEKAFLKSLTEDGWTEAEYLANLKDIILGEKVRTALMEGLDASPVEIEKGYKNNLDSFRVEEMEMAHILISAPDRDAPERGLKSIRTVLTERGIPVDSLDAAVAAELTRRETLAAVLRDSALAGADFAGLARRWSEDATAAQGGTLGLVARGRMVKAFDDASFALKKDGISPVVRTEFGFHVIKAVTDPVSRVQDLSEVEFTIGARIRADKEAAKLSALERKWDVVRLGTFNKGL